MAINSHGYDGIVAWGRFMGAAASDIQDRCDWAKRCGAPLEALYWQGSRSFGDWEFVPGHWVLPEHITNHQTRESLGLPPIYHPQIGSTPIGEAVARVHPHGADSTVYGFDVWDVRIQVQKLTDGRTVVRVHRDGQDEPVVLDGSRCPDALRSQLP